MPAGAKYKHDDSKQAHPDFPIFSRGIQCPGAPGRDFDSYFQDGKTYVFLSFSFRRLTRALPQLATEGYLWEGNGCVSRPLNMTLDPTPRQVTDCGRLPTPPGANEDQFQCFQGLLFIAHAVLRLKGALIVILFYNCFLPCYFRFMRLVCG